ncbi:MAG: preprotein translocase subunit SecG [Candidatus Eisenbacteria bacterium]
MVGFLMVIHYLVCFAMVLVILLQSGKGGGLAGAFGGGGSTIFGGRGAGTILTRATMVLGAMFFFTSLTLALLSAQRTGAAGGKSLIQQDAQHAAETQPSSGVPAGSRAPAGGAQLPSTGAPATSPGAAPAPATPAPATPAPGGK